MSKSAFTLIELLITIAIISILTGIAAVSYSGVQARGRDAQRINDLSQLKIGLNTYFNSQNPYQYPASAAKASINGTTDALSTALVPNYLREVPVDPTNAGDNIYKYQSADSATINSVSVYKGFNLYATLENKNNKKGWAGGSSWVVDGFILQDD